MEGVVVQVFIGEILDLGLRSVSVIGLGKNTGKTFTFNRLIAEASQLGITLAMTTIGLDGEDRDSLLHHDKPQVLLSPGQIVVNARALLLDSVLDYEILGTTGIMTPLGEIILARALSGGKTMLAGPGTRHELALVKEKLEGIGVDLFLVDGAIDRRSLAAPMVTDTTVLAVGAEASWDRAHLLEKLRLQMEILNLPAWEGQLPGEVDGQISDGDTKLVLLSDGRLQSKVSQQDFFQKPESLARHMTSGTQTVLIQGMLTDEVLLQILGSCVGIASVTLVAADPTHVFLSKQSFQRLRSQQVALRVLDCIRIMAVTVNPFHSRYGHADPLRLLADVGQAVYPIPTYDLNMGIRYRPEGEGFDAISRH